MKSLVKTIFLNTAAIAAVSYVAPGLTYNNNLATLLVAAVVLALVNAFVKPVLKLLLLPINVVTLGLLGWLIHVIILYLVTVLVSGFNVHPFTFEFLGISIVLSQFFAYVAISFLLNIATTLISWVLD